MGPEKLRRERFLGIGIHNNWIDEVIAVVSV